jgi:hypothetical protein
MEDSPDGMTFFKSFTETQSFESFDNYSVTQSKIMCLDGYICSQLREYWKGNYEHPKNLESLPHIDLTNFIF